jgi:hypothetical protein
MAYAKQYIEGGVTGIIIKRKEKLCRGITAITRGDEKKQKWESFPSQAEAKKRKARLVQERNWLLRRAEM